MKKSLKKLSILFLSLLFVSNCGSSKNERSDEDLYNDSEKLNDTDCLENDETDVVDEDVADFSETDETELDEDEQDDEVVEKPDADINPGKLGFSKVMIKQNPIITLTAIVEAVTNRESQIFVRFNEPGKEIKVTSRTKKGVEHRLIVAGMKAETLYEFEIVAVDEEGEEGIHESTFTTGKLPDSISEYQFNILKPEKMTKGITFIPTLALGSDLHDPEFIGIDENFHIVWYFPSRSFSSDKFSEVKTFDMLDDGSLILFNGDETVTANIGGEVIESIKSIELGVKIHHEVKKLDNESYIALLKEQRESTVEWSENPVTLLTDKIVVFNNSREIEWSWDTFDHLDTSYFPSALSKDVSGENLYDWTHANAIDVKGEEILACIRHHHQVVNIDRSSNALLWKLGENGDFVLKNMDRQNGIDWFYGPHNAHWVSDNEILIFDNGNDRPDGSSIFKSRAVLYKIDEIKMEAEQIWQFPLEYSYITYGGVQRTKDGSYLVCGGGVSEEGGTGTKIYEVTDDDPGQIIWELELKDESSYRAVKYPSMYSNK